MQLAIASIVPWVRTRPFDRLGRMGIFLRAVISFAVVPAVTWLAFQCHLNLSATSLLQLLAVLAIALRAGFWPAALSSVFANLCLNYFFIPPLFSLYIADPQNYIAIGVFEISALIVSRLSTQAQRQAMHARNREREVERLYDFSRELLLLAREGTQGREIVLLLQRIFAADAAVLLDGCDQRVYSAATTSEDREVLERETRRAYLEDNDHQLALAEGLTAIRVLRAGGERLAAIGLRGSLFTAGTANALASLIAISLERARSFEKEIQAEAERKAEQLRTTVLDALGHEYKTPLTALRAAASGLIEMGQLNPVQRELVSLIDSEVGRLNSVTTRLLRMSRLDSASVRLHPELVNPQELVQKVLANMHEVLAGHELHLQSLHGEALVEVDRELVSMALTQFLDNAAKHSAPASPITVSISATALEVCVSVHNFGPAIPAEEKGLIFQRFYRGAAARPKEGSTGIGLSITRKVADAHKGRVWVTSGEDFGNTFSLALPRPAGEWA